MEALVTFMAAYLSPWWVGLYITLAVVPYCYSVYSKAYLQGTDDLNQHYWPFARTDYKHWHYCRGVLANICFLFPLRTIACWLIVILIFLVTSVCMIGYKEGRPVPRWRSRAIFYGTSPLFRMLMLVAGLTWVKKERKKVDYSKYLGKSWRKTYSGAGI
jgi:hypothetical protein